MNKKSFTVHDAKNWSGLTRVLHAIENYEAGRHTISIRVPSNDPSLLEIEHSADVTVLSLEEANAYVKELQGAISKMKPRITGAV